MKVLTTVFTISSALAGASIPDPAWTKFNPANWFWVVAGDASKAWSSEAGAYVSDYPTDRLTRIASEDDLTGVLRTYGLRTPSVNDASVRALDYGRAFYFMPDAEANRLYIAVESRTSIRGAATEEYLLLAPHPRETTFQNNGNIYSSVVAETGGASSITFMIDQANNKAVVARRYDVADHANATGKHECRASPYNGGLAYQPKEVASSRMRKLNSFEDILAAAQGGVPMVGTVEYTADQKQIRVEFPVKVLNINPLTRTQSVPVGQQWQVASPRVPLYIPSETTACTKIRAGTLAFGNIGANTRVSFVYLKETAGARPTQDYGNTYEQTSTVTLYRIDP